MPFGLGSAVQQTAAVTPVQPRFSALPEVAHGAAQQDLEKRWRRLGNALKAPLERLKPKFLRTNCVARRGKVRWQPVWRLWQELGELVSTS